MISASTFGFSGYRGRTNIGCSHKNLLFSILFLFCLASDVQAEQSPHQASAEHVTAIPLDGRFCVDKSDTEYVCRDDPMEVRKEYGSPDYVKALSLGVPQRIDGNEEEKAGIREVIARMDEYYYGEVLSNPEYSEVRTYW